MQNQASRSGRISVAAWVAVAVVLALALCSGAASAQAGPTNLELLTSLTGDVVEDLLTALDGARAGRAVRLKAAANTEEYRLIETVFTSVMTERGVSVYQAAPGPAGDEVPPDVLELQYQALEFGVTYPKVFRTYLIGGKRVNREAGVKIVATLVDPKSGSVLQVEEASRGAADQFAHGERGEVEAGTFAFVKPELPGSGWTKVVEPVFVSGIIVGLIYLFFSNQSDE